MDLFGRPEPAIDRISPDAPLADRMRPRNLDEFVGQRSIVGPATPLYKSLINDTVGSIVFWGPPGSGKTTLAELIARSTKGQFVPFSAVTSGIKEIKEVITKAGSHLTLTGRRTYIFIDEIHRFNRAQQDAFLPFVEKGEIVLIGATTENPSFEVNSALLSRMRVYILERLNEDDIAVLIRRALTDSERGLGAWGMTYADDAVTFIAIAADGDARRALTLLETAATFVGKRGNLSLESLKAVHQKGILVYDKDREEHYNLISALHKTIRGGDPDAAIYWLARMLSAGDEPMYILRRLIRFAIEDIGLADPFALTLAIAARDTYHFLGSPEGEIALTQLVIYLACAPKSNATYMAHKAAFKDASEEGSLPVPLAIRNAPTGLMKGAGYGKGYRYAHDFEDAIADQEYFPDKLRGKKYYHPSGAGAEERHREYLEKYFRIRDELIEQRSRERRRQAH